MLLIIILCFTLAILGGLYLLSFVLRNKNTPKSIALMHGSLATLALVLLFIYVYLYHSSYSIISLILFILAAGGGGILMYLDIKGKSIPKWLAIGHGVMALIAFVFLLTVAFL
jgi:hypothetical protein